MAQEQAARQLAYRRRKRAQGICGWDGCDLVTRGTYYCHSHNEHFKALRRARNAARAVEAPEKAA